MAILYYGGLLVLYELIYRFFFTRKRKYAYSPIFFKIHKLYGQWFSENRRNLNSKQTSINKIRYSIYELKQLLKENGAQISDIRGYTEHLSKNGASHKWVSILITGTTVLGGNVVLVAVFTDIYKVLKNAIKSIDFGVIIRISVMLLIVCLMVRTMYIIIKMLLINGEFEEYSIFQEVLKIFEEEIELEAEELESTSELKRALDIAVGPIKMNWLRNWIKKVRCFCIKPLFLRTLICGSMLILVVAAVLVIFWSFRKAMGTGIVVATAVAIVVGIIPGIMFINIIYDLVKFSRSKRKE